jgi:PadR family transcriptional regulator PadR
MPTSRRHHGPVPVVERDPQLLKGALTILLLHVLAERESYGYEVVQRLHEIGLPEIAPGTVYPALARLEREERLAARLVPSNEGPARKYYRPTAAGRAALAAGIEQWESLAAVVSRQLARPVPDHPKES